MKKIKMKKFLCIGIMLFVPLITLTGCSNSYYLRTSTTKTATEFLYSISQDTKNFSQNVNSTINTALLLGEDSEFDVQAIRDDESAHNMLNSKILDFAQETNTEALFATSIYQIASENREQSFFDMSFLSKVDSDQLKNFFVQTESKTSKKVVYKYQLTGIETADLNLPITVVEKNADLCDDIDNIIKTWGNNLKFTVEAGTGYTSKNVTISTAFLMPTQNEIKESLKNTVAENDYEIDNNKVTIYYNNGQALTKEIEFITNGQIVEKKVTKYNGDKRVNTGLSGQSYYYTLKISEDSTINILGEYTIMYDMVNSYISCHITHSNSNKSQLEYFKTQSGELIGRFYNKETSGRSVVNLIVNNDLETGLIKYDYQRSTIKYKALSEEINLSNTFCAITDEDRTLAKSNQLTNVEILNYTIDEKSIVIDRANVVKEQK